MGGEAQALSILEDPQQIHAFLTLCAQQVSDELARALEHVGPAQRAERPEIRIGEFVARTVVNQQLSKAAANAIWERASHAGRLADMDVLSLAEARPDDLLVSGVSANKVRTIRGIASAETSGLLPTSDRAETDVGQVVRTLMSLWGVGPWTCDMALIFYYCLPDVWPLGDVAVQRTFSCLAGPSAHRVDEFRPHRSTLARAMWRVADAA